MSREKIGLGHPRVYLGVDVALFGSPDDVYEMGRKCSESYLPIFLRSFHHHPMSGSRACSVNGAQIFQGRVSLKSGVAGHGIINEGSCLANVLGDDSALGRCGVVPVRGSHDAVNI